MCSRALLDLIFCGFREGVKIVFFGSIEDVEDSKMKEDEKHQARHTFQQKPTSFLKKV